jgi:hypothetical protein
MAKFKAGVLRESAIPVFVVDEDGTNVGSKGKPLQAQLPRLHYIGGEYWNKPNNQELNVPADATIVSITAETAACYYQINGVSASLSSYGYVGTTFEATIGPLDNLESMRIHSPDGKVHVQYFREA